MYLSSLVTVFTLRELSNIIRSDLANALSGRLDSRVEALRKLVGGLADAKTSQAS